MKFIERVGNMASSYFEAVCQFTIGRFFVRMLDHSVGIIEKTAQWSLPRHEITSTGNGKSFKSMELVRPLPWILFLPGLVILRGFRFVWNVGASVIGYPEIHPSDIVKSLQKIRRHLCCIRISATKRMQMKATQNTEHQNLELNATKRSLLRSILLTLSTLSCIDASKTKSSPPPMQIRVPMNYEVTSALDDKSAIESTMKTKQYEAAKRKHSEVSSDDLTLNEESESGETSFNTKLSHCALNSSTDDPDFTPQNCTAESNDLEESFENEVEGDKGEYDKLMEEAQEILTEDYKKTNLESLDKQMNENVNTHIRTKKKESVKNGNGNCMTENLDEVQDFYSPCSYKDAEATFFLPISSKSTSPERELTADDIGTVLNNPTTKKVNTPESSKVVTKETMDINYAQNNINFTEKKDYEAIDSFNIRGKQQHENLKGKRGNHGNRKKK